mmetsp:Transcript_23148/g.64367  ORF Transcript_23148/g.64367 Transcript_23148/m.64367 type:complete len:231 (-) Transcript_23148:1581-2273(-)
MVHWLDALDVVCRHSLSHLGGIPAIFGPRQSSWGTGSLRRRLRGPAALDGDNLQPAQHGAMVQLRLGVLGPRLPSFIGLSILAVWGTVSSPHWARDGRFGHIERIRIFDTQGLSKMHSPGFGSDTLRHGLLPHFSKLILHGRAIVVVTAATGAGRQCLFDCHAATRPGLSGSWAFSIQHNGLGAGFVGLLPLLPETWRVGIHSLCRSSLIQANVLVLLSCYFCLFVGNLL